MKPPSNGTGYEAEPTCGGKARADGTCKNTTGSRPATRALPGVRSTAAATQTHERAATTELAPRQCSRLGIPIETDPGDALLQAVWECAWNVAMSRELVQQLPLRLESDEYVAGEDGDGHWQRRGARHPQRPRVRAECRRALPRQQRALIDDYDRAFATFRPSRARDG